MEYRLGFLLSLEFNQAALQTTLGFFMHLQFLDCVIVYIYSRIPYFKYEILSLLSKR